MKSLITGISGFVGHHLTNYLLKNNHQVFGFDKNKTEINKAKIFQADILNKEQISSIIEETKPDYIFHLAAISSVVKSIEMPELTMDINVNGTKNILDACIKANINPKILIVTSAHVYGIPKQIPIKEDHPLQPNTPYAESRVKQEKLALDYQKKHNLKIIISRSFNHTGPGRQPEFVCSDFAKQIAEIEKNLREPVINVGDISVKRDFTDVRDIVKAYLLAVEKCIPGQIYHICSARFYSIKQILDILLSMTKTKIEIKQDQNKLRKAEIPILIGDNSKFIKQTGWQPEIPMETTLKDILDYWREKI